tara:strand:+ start:948 stop:1562 length:615 start_codon:yes stop_codon:yes gene_type:complete
VNEKKCTKCSLILPETKEFFYRQKTTKSGFRASCKKCCDKKAMKYYDNNKEKIKELHKQWAQNNRQHINKYIRDKRASLSPEELEAVREKERLRQQDWKNKKCTSGVYIITNKINGKVYVGESYAIEARWVSHRSALNQERKCNPELLNDWKTYGKEAFEFKIIKELTDSSKEIRLLEEEKTILDLKQQGVVVYNSNKDRRRII